MKINIPRTVCKHIVGQDHSFQHHATVGIVVMLVGVGIAKTVGHVEYTSIAIIGDALGYSLHGIDLIPFIESVVGEIE